MPSISALMNCSPHWQIKLCGRLEIAIQEVYEDLSEKMREVRECAATITRYKTELEASGRNISFTFTKDLELLLNYLCEEDAKWSAKITNGSQQQCFHPSALPRYLICAIQRLRSDLTTLK